jgi:hypothetical protein
MRKLILCVFLTIGVLCQLSSQIKISNLESRINTKGEIVDLHDGRIIQFGNKYYWYGTRYGNTSGFTKTNKYFIASSNDMKTWKEEGAVFNNEPSGVYYRPHVLYNAKTKKYILWYNWYPMLWNGKFGVAISDKPTGPFEIVNTDVNVAHKSMGVGDFNLFLDDDGTAYMGYNTISNHKLSIEKLSPDFLSSTMENSGFITEHCEAGSIFKKDKKYYLLTDITCCFCTQGSGARVYTSTNPLSGYQYSHNINRYSGTVRNEMIDGQKIPQQYTTIKKVKGMFPEIEIQSKSIKNIDEVKIHIFTGNRNGSCGDTVRSYTHDAIVDPVITLKNRNGMETWKSLSTKVSNKRNSIISTINLKLNKPTSLRKLLVSFDSSYVYDNLQIAEVELYSAGKRIQLSSTNTIALVNDIDSYWGPPIIPAQQTHIMEISKNGKKQYLWMGDLWGSAPDNIKGHDMQYWAPLEFDKEGNIMPLKWVDEFRLD